MLTYSAQAAWGDDVEMPELDLADLHPGTQIVMPRVQEVSSGG